MPLASMCSKSPNRLEPRAVRVSPSAATTSAGGSIAGANHRGSFLGALKDAVGQASGGAAIVEAPVADYPTFGHPKAKGHRLLPEQLKAMLKALGQRQ